MFVISDAFTSKIPKSPVRELLEMEPETAKFEYVYFIASFLALVVIIHWGLACSFKSNSRNIHDFSIFNVCIKYCKHYYYLNLPSDGVRPSSICSFLQLKLLSVFVVNLWILESFYIYVTQEARENTGWQDPGHSQRGWEGSFPWRRS